MKHDGSERPAPFLLTVTAHQPLFRASSLLDFRSQSLSTEVSLVPAAVTDETVTAVAAAVTVVEKAGEANTEGFYRRFVFCHWQVRPVASNCPICLTFSTRAQIQRPLMSTVRRV